MYHVALKALSDRSLLPLGMPDCRNATLTILAERAPIDVACCRKMLVRTGLTVPLPDHVRGI
jgi:hypothetical protein